MKDPIEEALEKLVADELPPELMARLTGARSKLVDESRGQRGFWGRWLLPITMGGCAAALALAWLRWEESKNLEHPTVAQVGLPFERQEIFVGAREVGLLVAPNQRPYRVMEIEWLEQDTVRPSEQGPAVRVETTRRGVIPVALEIF